MMVLHLTAHRSWKGAGTKCFILVCVCVCVCVCRVHELEEQIKDQETRSDQILEEELKRHREALNKMERDKMHELELLGNR